MAKTKKTKKAQEVVSKSKKKSSTTSKPSPDYSKPLKNGQYETFSQEYIINSNGTRAAKEAGYSKKTARSKANQLLTIVDIKGRIKHLQKELSERAGVKAEQVISELVKVGFSNIQDFVRIDDEGNIYFKSFDTISRDKLAAVESIKTTRKTIIGKDDENDIEIMTTQFKLHSKISALEKIGRNIGMFVNKHELSFNKETMELLGMIDGSTKGQLPDAEEGEDAG